MKSIQVFHDKTSIVLFNSNLWLLILRGDTRPPYLVIYFDPSNQKAMNSNGTELTEMLTYIWLERSFKIKSKRYLFTNT